MIYFWNLLTIFLLLKSYSLLPVQEKSKKINNEVKLNILDSTTYLQRFGYLPGADQETGALRSEAEYTRAIRHFQHFANIPQTGHLDAETRSFMVRPRCGIPDQLDDQHGRVVQGHSRPAEYNLGPSRWQKNWITFRILNYTPDLDYNEVRDAFIRSFHLWSKVTNISFHEVDNGYADIYIQFSSGYHQDGYPFDGPGMVLAHAFFPGEDRGGDMHFDEDELWTARSDKGVNLFTVVAHELGHSLGLAHSSIVGSLMYPWHQGYKPDLALHYDDIIAIQQLYGAKNSLPVPPIPPVEISTSTTVLPSTNTKSTKVTITKKKKVPTATLR